MVPSRREEQMERTAACSCGQLAITVDGQPAHHGLCSCLACQRESGSAFTYGGYWPRAAVMRIDGESARWRRIADSGKWLERHFCPRCGSAVFTYAEWAPDMVNIGIGSFADPGFPPPDYAVWNRHRHPWVTLHPDWMCHDEQPSDDEGQQPAP